MTRTTHNTIADLRAQVAALHSELTRNNLVVWTAGNVSARVPGEDLLVIKPSGVSYDELSADAMVVCDLDGNLVEGDRLNKNWQPSSDTAAHAYVYRHMPEIGGVVHTHSTYATAWAARGEAIPCVLTMIADEFGGEIPVGPFALIGDDSIGRGIVETLRESRSKAVLMRNHGPFTVGKDARAAVKAAVMVEDVARTVHLSRQLGEPIAIAPADVDSLYDRYQNVYGQDRRPARGASSECDVRAREVWFLTGSQHLYGPEVLDQVAANAGDIVRALDASADVPVRVVSKPVLTEAAAIRRALLDAESDDACVGVIAWMHTFSPAKMWITGLDHLRKPLLHLHTQANEALPWAEIDMDFMNLNQAAHGDREFAAVQTRLGVTRKTVAGHVERPRGRPPRRRLGAGRRRPRRDVDDEARPLRRQHAQRRGHRGRQGRGGASVRRLGQHLGRQRPRRGGGRCRGQADRRPRGRVRRHVRRRRPTCCPAATATTRCATAPASSWACARS